MWNEGETAEDGSAFMADSADDAAEAMAADVLLNGDPFSSIEVVVRDENGDEWEATVDVDWDPTFYVHSKPRKRAVDEAEGKS